MEPDNYPTIAVQLPEIRLVADRRLGDLRVKPEVRDIDGMGEEFWRPPSHEQEELWALRECVRELVSAAQEP